jgi:dipeptidyl aminopeptidase/acylaminoacyl peptidase
MVGDRNQSGLGPGRGYLILTLLYLAVSASANATSSNARGDAPLALPTEAVVSANEFAPFHRPSESSDGEWVAYCVIATTARSSRVRNLQSDFTKTGVVAPYEYGDIWVTNIGTSRSRNLTGGVGSNWSPVWSPDGHYLAFYSDRPGSGAQGQAKLWVWDRSTDKVQQISDVPLRASMEPVWLPGDRVLTTTLPEDESSQSPDAARSSSAVHKETNTENSSTVKVYRSDPPETETGTEANKDGSKTDGFMNLAQPAHDFSVISIASGAVQRVFRAADVWRYAVSPDGGHVVTSVAKRYATKGGYAVLFDLIDYDLKSGSRFEAATDVLLDPFREHVSWSPTSTQFSYRTSGPDADGSIYVVDVDKSPAHLVAGASPGSAATRGLPLWDSSGRDLYFPIGDTLWRTSAINGGPKKLGELPGRKLSIVPRDGNQVWSTSKGTLVLRADDPTTKQSGWYRASEDTNSVEMMLLEDKSYAQPPLFQVSHDARHVIYLAEDAQNEPNLWLANASFSQRRRLTEINPQFARYKMGESQLIEWRDIDGKRLHGALLLPAGYDKTKKYPLIVEVYGGQSLSNWLNRFGESNLVNGQIFATRGYIVLHPDAPQSEGTPMVDLMKTIMPGVERAVGLGIADPDRIGLMGHSYGGYSVFSLVVQTTRFKAAVAMDGVADIVGLYGQMSPDGQAYGQSSPEHGQFLLGGTLWSSRDRYIENSPIFYLDRVKTPMLIIHGSEDSGAAAFQADGVFVDLRRLGKEATYAKYMGEDHVPTNWSYANQIDWLNRIIDWFDVHLKR